MQHAAVFSQLEKHDDALKSAEKCMATLKAVLCGLFEILNAVAIIGPNNVTGLGSFEHGVDNILTYVEFLKNLDVSNSASESFWNSNIPIMKINKASTLKYIMQKIESQRGSQAVKGLTRKIQHPWIDVFHIPNVVKLQPVNQFESKLEFGEFDEALVCRIALLLSCCIFSIAAENRFISHEEIADETSKSLRIDRKQKYGSMLEETSKDLKLQRHRRFIFSEHVHLRALELLIFAFTDNIKLLNHFFQSYKKNYSFSILAIEEVEEHSFSTARKSEYFDPELQLANNRFPAEDGVVSKRQMISMHNIKSGPVSIEIEADLLKSCDEYVKSESKEPKLESKRLQPSLGEATRTPNSSGNPTFSHTSPERRLVFEKAKQPVRAQISPSKQINFLDIDNEKEMRQAFDKNFNVHPKKLNFQKVKPEHIEANSRQFRDLNKKLILRDLQVKTSLVNPSDQEHSEKPQNQSFANEIKHGQYKPSNSFTGDYNSFHTLTSKTTSDYFSSSNYRKSRKEDVTTSLERLRQQFRQRTSSLKKDQVRSAHNSINISQTRDNIFAKSNKAKIKLISGRQASANEPSIELKNVKAPQKSKEATISSKYSSLLNQINQNMKARGHIASEQGQDNARINQENAGTSSINSRIEILFKKAKC